MFSIICFNLLYFIWYFFFNNNILLYVPMLYLWLQQHIVYALKVWVTTKAFYY